MLRKKYGFVFASSAGLASFRQRALPGRLALLARCAVGIAIVIAAFAGTAFAQGSRKDDIVFNAQGRPMAGATVRVCTSAATGQPCSPLASIFSDAAMTQALANPLSADGLGNYTFYAAPGRYEIEISGPGITTKQLPNVILPSDPSSPTFTTVTTTSGITAFSLSLSGNLTVTGSTSVAGTLTVGGAPVPSTGADNQWAGNQRFKGPTPYRDVTAYMPPGGCSSTLAEGANDPPTTGSISSGTSTLTIGSAVDFKNGCGIAVLGAGPTTTQPAPNGGCTISSIQVTSNVVTVTCSAAHNIPTGTVVDTGVVISGVTNSAFNGTFPVTSVADTTHFTYNLTLANTSSSGGTATTQWGYAHGYPQNLQIAAISRSSNVTTVILQKEVQQLSQYSKATIAGVTDGTYNASNVAITVLDAMRFTYANSGSNGSSSSGNVALAGGTTFNYKVSACDSYGGCSAASAAIPVTGSLAALTTDNYNWISYAQSWKTGVINNTYTNVARMYLIYSDKGLGGAYSCVGTSFDEAYDDYGLNMPCPPFAPSTPPASATAQMLNTTIASGAGTTTLTLAASASNSASSVNVYHDESSFLNSCINDMATSRFSGAGPNEFGCYLPAGNYGMNGPMQSDVGTFLTAGGNIKIAGSVYFNTLPWIFSVGQWNVEGQGFDNNSAVFSHKPTTSFYVGAHLPAAVVFREFAGNSRFSGFTINNAHGHGIWQGGCCNSAAPSALDFSNLIINESSGGGGAPMYFNGNIITDWVDQVELTPNASGGLPSMLFSVDDYNDNTDCCFYISNIQSQLRAMKFQVPGGSSNGSFENIDIRNWIHENQLSAVHGFVEFDGGLNAPGALATSGGLSLTMANIDNSDSGASGETLIELTNDTGSTYLSTSGAIADFSGGMIGCSAHSVACSPGRAQFGGLFSVGGLPANLPGAGFMTTGTGTFLTHPLYTGATNTMGTAGTPSPIWAAPMPAPYSLQVTATGSGSLSAATYCIVVEGKDAQFIPGLTLPSNEVCVTLGASSSVMLSWQEGQSNTYSGMYSGCRIFYGGAPGAENNYIDTSCTSSPTTYTFTSTSGATSGTLQTSPTAFLSWMYWTATGGGPGGNYNNGCIYCGGNTALNLGIGQATPATKLDVNGAVNTSSFYRANETTAPTCAASQDFLWADSTAHAWKKCENSGTVFGVPGTLSGTSGSIGGSALTAGQCASGTVSMAGATTSMTVTVSPNTYPGDGMIPWGYVSASGTVTVKVCAQASGTPTSSTYNVRVIQ